MHDDYEITRDEILENHEGFDDAQRVIAALLLIADQLRNICHSLAVPS